MIRSFELRFTFVYNIGHAILAQLVERSIRNAKVPSSILGDGSKKVAISEMIWYATRTKVANV